MIKLVLILLFGLGCESTGVILLKKGITRIGSIEGYTASELIRIFKAGATCPQILGGVFFEAIFFGCLMFLMAKSDISFLWPMTALSFVFATFAAMVFLGESVSWVRWTGVALIMIGAAFISYSEHSKDAATPPAVTAAPDATQGK